MLIKVANLSGGGTSPVSMRCPACRQVGTFEALHQCNDITVVVENNRRVWLGQRQCPNTACRTHVFVVHDHQTRLIQSYPPERLDFDPANIPALITKSLTEAVTCHANECYIASAILIRRCLEELCDDKQAQGANLKERIGALRGKVLLPSELFVALDELRLLGNDAAHLEARLYDQIGKEEVEAGMELTKEILKAVYQLDALVSRLKALKKP